MRQRSLALLLAAPLLSGAIGYAAATVDLASAGHPQGTSSQPGNCVATHGGTKNCYDWYVPLAGTGAPFYLRTMVETGIYWDQILYYATWAWNNNIEGPHEISSSPHAQDTFVYFKTAADGQDPLGDVPEEGGVTYRCRTGYPAPYPCTTWTPDVGVWGWSEIYVDEWLQQNPDFNRDIHIVAHELGHSLLLTHHDDGAFDNYPLMESQYGDPNDPGVGFYLEGPDLTEEGSSFPPCNVRPASERSQFGIRCIFQFYDSYTPDLIITSVSGCGVSADEGSSVSCSIVVKNQGTLAAGPFAVRVTFDGAARPYPQGICAFNSGLVVAQTQICSTGAVTANFSGGSVLATVDYLGQVAELYEGNNTKTSGTLAVKPKAATALFIAPPYAAYGYTDNSALETGFGIKLERKSGTCSGSTGWSIFSQVLNAPLAGTGQAVTIAPFSPVSHGYCYRVKVTALGQYANSTEKTSSTVWYP